MRPFTTIGKYASGACASADRIWYGTDVSGISARMRRRTAGSRHSPCSPHCDPRDRRDHRQNPSTSGFNFVCSSCCAVLGWTHAGSIAVVARANSTVTACTPKKCRGNSQRASRNTWCTCDPRTAANAAMSTALLPNPTITTRLPASASSPGSSRSVITVPANDARPGSSIFASDSL
jgi:hypothetical protein